MFFSKTVVLRLYELKMKRSYLAKLMGINHSYLNDLIRGRCRWNEEKMIKACEALNLEIKFEPKAS